MRRIFAVSWKKVMSSFGEVSTEREGGSQLWPMKGTLVSTVMGVVSDENGRCRDGVNETEVVRGLRRLELRWAKALKLVKAMI